MSIVNKIIDLNSQYEELTGEKLKTLRLHWSYKEELEEALCKTFFYVEDESIKKTFIDGIEISFTEKPNPEPQSYMWGKEVAEILSGDVTVWESGGWIHWQAPRKQTPTYIDRARKNPTLV